ncbi:hypothetical protein [Microbacterium abyssi]|uniref:hypothetical protein n=1 Tax=Microbacterium abyssi TaxID=2782166 RepID=UPI001888EA9B|nr:hypothetical protein [Microbacterium sp. A18JL241]
MNGPVEPAPMAFVRQQLWRGAISAWIVFLALMLTGVAVVTISASMATQSAVASLPMLLVITLLAAALVGGVISLVITLIGVPVAGAISRLLQNEPRVYVHVVVYTALGAVVCVIVALIAGAVVQVSPLGLLTTPLGFVIAAACVAAPPIGWWHAYRSSLRPRAS